MVVAEFFAYLRRKKQEWSKNPRARLTQAEVDEANGVIDPTQKPIIITAPRVKELGSKVGPLTAIVGSAAAAALFVSVPKHEGTEYKAYRDIVGVWTICQGDTNNVSPGMIETPNGCRERLERQLVIHARGVMLCTPTLREEGRDWQRAAATSLAYNIGVAGWCRSSIDKLWERGEWRKGCDRFLLYNKAGGKTVRGLVNRREDEHKLCVKGLPV